MKNSTNMDELKKQILNEAEKVKQSIKDHLPKPVEGPQEKNTTETNSTKPIEEEAPNPFIALYQDAAAELTDVDNSTVPLYKKFGQHLFDTRTFNITTPEDLEVFPYRTGAYYVYEANNKTK